MRHGKKFNHLGRTATHRKAMLSNMASSLIINKRITTTVAKAKALRQYVEPLITRSKTDTTQSRRVVFSYLQDKVSSQVLFSEVAEAVADRPGGYTRIIKLGSRLGDNAEMALIELVDFNDLYTQSEEKTKRTRRSRRGRGKKSGDSGQTEAASAASTTEETQDASTNVEPADEVTAATAQSNDSDEATSDEASSDEAASSEVLDTAPAPEEDTPVVEVKEEGDAVELSGEAVVGEPVVVEESDETAEASADETTEEEGTEGDSQDGDTKDKS